MSDVRVPAVHWLSHDCGNANSSISVHSRIIPALIIVKLQITVVFRSWHLPRFEDF